MSETPDLSDLFSSSDPMSSYFLYLSLAVAARQVALEPLDERIEELVRRWKAVASA